MIEHDSEPKTIEEWKSYLRERAIEEGERADIAEAKLVRLAQLWENGSRYGMIAANWGFFFVEMELVVKEYASKKVKPRAKRCRLVER